MRIRYGYKITFKDSHQEFVVWNHVHKELDILKQYADKGAQKVELHERVKTGFRLTKDGELVPTNTASRQSVSTPATLSDLQ